MKVEDGVKALWVEAAGREGVSLSAWVRDAVGRYLVMKEAGSAITVLPDSGLGGERAVVGQQNPAPDGPTVGQPDPWLEVAPLARADVVVPTVEVLEERKREMLRVAREELQD